MKINSTLCLTLVVLLIETFSAVAAPRTLPTKISSIVAPRKPSPSSPKNNGGGKSNIKEQPCAKNEFTCGNKQCIPKYAVCNGTAECSNGKDESCTVINSGKCSSSRRYLNLCDSLSGADKNSNITAQFLCHTENLLKNGSITFSCINDISVPAEAYCTRICQPLTLPTANFTCLLNGKNVNCSQPLLVGTKVYPQCEFYYRPSHKEIICQSNGEWSQHTIECISECGRQFKDKMRYTRSMRSVEYREFPWAAAVYYTKPGTTNSMLIPGTIISPYLVITTAINFYADYREGKMSPDLMTVIVAKRTKEEEATDDQFQKTYKIRDIYFTDAGFQSYDLSFSSENIAIIEVDEKIVLSPSVYPACVNWARNDLLLPEEGTIGQVPHTLSILEANASATVQHEILQTVASRYVSRDQCINTDTMKNVPHVVRMDIFCSEPAPPPSACDGAFIFLEPITNLFYIQGLVDGVTPSVDSPLTFTNTFVDLYSHMDWINAVRKNNEDRFVTSETRLVTEAGDLSAICKKNATTKRTTDIETRLEVADDNEQGLSGNSTAKCILPDKNSLHAHNYSINCPLNMNQNECRKIKENSSLDEFTTVKIVCKEGHVANETEAVCFKGKWSPVLEPCKKLCEKLPQFENGNLICYGGEHAVNCSIDLLVGTRVVPQCDPPYKLERRTESQEITCEDSGKWTSTLPKCVKRSVSSTRIPHNIQGVSKSDTNTGNTPNQGSNGANTRKTPYQITNESGGNVRKTSTAQVISRSNSDSCSEDEFSCGKICIQKKAICNGTVECENGKDESPEFCKVLSTSPCSSSSKFNNYCKQELSTTEGIQKSNSKMKQSFLCNMADVNITEGVTINCVNGVATPAIPCKRICQNITVIVSGLECFLNNKRVDCKKPLLIGTKLVPHCEAEYKPTIDEVICNENGEWINNEVECVPECGKSSRNSTKMTRTIRAAQFREFPWNVAVYRKTEQPPILFAGIIISPYLVLTNAKCCRNEMNNNQPATDIFEVFVGKRSADMETEDDDYQKSVKVKTVHFSNSLADNSEDIAIIELSEKITICPAVTPACVNWNKNKSLIPQDGTIGQIPHWRTRNVNNSDTTHELLQTVSLIYHSRDTCQRQVDRKFLRYLTKDAFCVDQISTMTPAHRGAGFIFQESASNLSYVQGIIYFTGINGITTSFSNMFLDVIPHMEWINSIRQKIEKRIHRNLVLNNRIQKDDEICKSYKNQGEQKMGSNFISNGFDDFLMSHGCELPSKKDWQYLDYTVNCLPDGREDECNKSEPGSVVPEFASLTLTCNEGYVSNGSDEVVCFRNKWSPNIEPCKKLCDRIQLESVNLKCFSMDKRVPCDDNLRSGTTAIVECAPYFQPARSLPKLICDEYGHWSGVSDVKCTPFDPWNEQGEKEVFFNYTVTV